MEKSFIEKKIKEKAEEKFFHEDELMNEVIGKNPILRRMIIKAYNKNGKLIEIHLCKICINGAVPGYSLYQNETLAEFTNYEEIEKELIKKYEKEEGDNLFEKLDNIYIYFSKKETDK